MRERFESGRDRVRPLHRLAWLWEPLEREPAFVLRAMFGTQAAYLDGKLMLCFCAGEEPWRGVLVCTARGQHAALCAEFPEVAPHPILGKWLYLPEESEEFERAATRLVGLVLRRDPRIGVTPNPKKPRASRVRRLRPRP